MALAEVGAGPPVVVVRSCCAGSIVFKAIRRPKAPDPLFTF
jgi:hypothetical protein